MRETKLRYYLKNHKTNETKFVYLSLDALQSGAFQVPENNLWGILGRDEFTGLTDRNGVEIFEGDIFTFTAGKKRLTAQVVFEDAMFKMSRKDGWGAMILQKESDMEVIGNIYTDPELTKEQK